MAGAYATRHRPKPGGLALKDQAQAKFELPSTLFCTINPKCCAGNVIVGPETIHVIEQVISLRSQLHGETLGGVKILEQRCIDVGLMFAGKNVTAARPKFWPGGIVGENRRSRRTEDLSLKLLATRSHAGADVCSGAAGKD